MAIYIWYEHECTHPKAEMPDLCQPLSKHLRQPVSEAAPSSIMSASPVRPYESQPSQPVDDVFLQQKTLKKLIQNLPDLPKRSTFNHLQQVVPPQGAWNRLPMSFSELDNITPIQIFNLFLTNSIMGQLVANTNSYAQQQLLGPEKECQHSWQPVTAQNHFLWLAIHIHMDLIEVAPGRYSIKDGVYLLKDETPPAAYLGKTRFQEMSNFFLHSPYNSPTETPEGIPCWYSMVDSLLVQLLFSLSSTEYLAAMFQLITP